MSRTSAPAGAPVERAEATSAAGPPRRSGALRRALTGLAGSCALVGFALLACLVLVAVGAVTSLVWAFVVDR